MASPENDQALRTLDSLFTKAAEADSATNQAPVHPDDERDLGKLQAVFGQRDAAYEALQPPVEPNEAVLNPEDQAAVGQLRGLFRERPDAPSESK